MQKQVFKFKPNLAQREALIAFDKLERNKGVMVLPTAAGKTFLSALVAKKYSGKILFVAHNQEILEQSKKTFKNIFGNKVLMGFYNGYEKQISKITFATVQTLSRNLDKFNKNFFDLIIIDEVHHYQAVSYKKAIEYFEPNFLLGLTATPFRTDSKDIFEICGDEIYNMSTQRAIKEGLLCKFDYFCVDNDIDFSKIKWNGRKYVEKDLNKKLCIPEYDNAIFDEWVKNASGKKTIVFCSTIEHSKRLEKVFQNRGVKSCSLDGKTSRAWRHRIVNDFRNSEKEIIFTVNLFNEGVDIPDTECIMFLRPTESEIIFTQQFGRGLRVKKRGKKLLVLDFVRNAKKDYINISVLEKIIGKNILNNLIQDSKDLLIKNLGCSVRLSKQRIDFLRKKIIKKKREKPKFKLGPRKKYTEKDLYDEYKRVEKIIGKRPASTIFGKEKIEIEKKYNFKIAFSEHVFQRKFGKWSNFLKKFNIKLIRPIKIIRGELKNEFVIEATNKILLFYNKNNRKPNYKLGELSKEVNRVSDAYDGITNFYKQNGMVYRKTGDERKKELLIVLKLMVQKENVIPNLRVLEEKLGCGGGTIKSYFGGIAKFMKQAGLYEMYRKQRNILSKEELIQKIKELAKTKNKSKIKFLEFFRETGISQTLVEKHFNSYNNFIKQSGLEVTIHSKHTKETIKQTYSDCFNKLGRLPNQKEYPHCNIQRHFGTIENLRRECGFPLKHKKNSKWNRQKVIESYKQFREKLGRKPTSKEMRAPSPSWSMAKKYFGGMINLEKEYLKQSKTNLSVIENYIPKNEVKSNKIIDDNKTIYKNNNKKSISLIKKQGRQHNFGEKKDEVRTKILKKIKDGDTVFLLESPELYAVKEIIELGIKPRKVIIPNHQEFDTLVRSFREIEQNLPFKVEVVNTSALQLLTDTEEKFDFLWLDYYGAFCNYTKDIEVLIERNLLSKTAKVLGTYRILDFRAKNETHYYTEAISFVHRKMQDYGLKFDIIQDIGCRYKSTMYNIGFEVHA